MEIKNQENLTETKNKSLFTKNILNIIFLLIVVSAVTFLFRFTNNIENTVLKIVSIYAIYIFFIALVFAVLHFEKKSIKQLGFTKEKLSFQILIGIIIAVVLSFLLAHCQFLLAEKTLL